LEDRKANKNFGVRQIMGSGSSHYLSPELGEPREEAGVSKIWQLE